MRGHAGDHQPSIGVGHYAVLINSGQRRWRPNWSLVDWDPHVGVLPAGTIPAAAWRNWHLLSLEVRPA
jgi:hypothetical protein